MHKYTSLHLVTLYVASLWGQNEYKCVFLFPVVEHFLVFLFVVCMTFSIWVYVKFKASDQIVAEHSLKLITNICEC